MKCKNCNVKVASYLEKCPLCGDKLNDNITYDNPYNSQIERFSKKVNTIYFTKLVYKLLIFSSLIVMLINYLINKKINWSLYVLFSSIYISSFYTFIILKNKKAALFINIFCLELLLFMISYLTNSVNWFIFLVGPIIFLITLFVYLNIYLTSNDNILRNFSCLILYILICLILINGLIKIYNTNVFEITWSIYTTIVLSIISLISFILSFNKKITNEFEKRFFI